ncbi:MAG: hypothetical protein K0V04_42295 [Deltaproteobacteria bacterium]|nr:hypothetical protein [Deltaproteobacteria bacterium]
MVTSSGSPTPDDTSSGGTSSTTESLGSSGGSTTATLDDTGSTGADSSSGTSGEPLSDEELCELGCAWEVECFPGYPLRVCIEDCLFNLGVFDAVPRCDAAMEDTTLCLSEFESCRPERFSRECEQAFDALDACDEQFSCDIFGGGPIDQSSCDVTADCNGQVRTLECDTEVCTCTENGVQTGQCAAMGLCMDFDPFDPLAIDNVIAPFVEGCCGWEDFGSPPVPGGDAARFVGPRRASVLLKNSGTR